MFFTELSNSAKGRILAAGLRRNDSIRGRSPNSSGETNSLEGLIAGVDAVLVCEEQRAGEIEESMVALWE